MIWKLTTRQQITHESIRSLEKTTCRHVKKVKRMEEMISKRDLLEHFTHVDWELSEMMKDVPNAETTINLVFYVLYKTIFPQEKKWKEINGGD